MRPESTPRATSAARPRPRARCRGLAGRSRRAASAVALEARGRHRVVHDQPDVAGAGHQSVLQHHVAAAAHRDRDERQARLDGQKEAAALEAADRAVGAAGAFREAR